MELGPLVDDFRSLLPDLRGARTLAVGLGGGSDIVTAYALAQAIDAGSGAILYANTKTRAEADLALLSPHLGRLPPEVTPLPRLRAGNGSTGIDRAIPRGPDGCPLIAILPPRPHDDAVLTDELAALRLDHVLAVDTGGDALAPARSGRDRRMLAVVSALGVPVHLVVVAPGADGQSATPVLTERLRAAQPTLRGVAPAAPLLATYRLFAPYLPANRTPCLVLAAHDAAGRGDASFVVPRGCRPCVPVAWMTSMLIFDGIGLLTPPAKPGGESFGPRPNAADAASDASAASAACTASAADAAFGRGPKLSPPDRRSGGAGGGPWRYSLPDATLPLASYPRGGLCGVLR